LCVIIIANLLDTLTGQDLFRMAIVYFFIATEGISILENLAKMGVPVPKILLDKLKQVQGETEEVDMKKEAPKE
jgi:toxin secretion/phage lysis holin